MLMIGRTAPSVIGLMNLSENHDAANGPGLYGQAYAIPTKNKKMTTEVKGTFDNHKLVIDNDQIHSFKIAARAHKASSSNATTQQNTASQQNTNNTATQQATTGQSNTGTTNTQQAATSPTTNNNNATTNQQSSTKSQEAQRSDSTATTSQQSYANRVMPRGVTWLSERHF